ncbi:MAG: pilus assembly protein [Proteobacteria bacterium]|nr:pilus assembly protein [Pseudomonadota bacterium]
MSVVARLRTALVRARTFLRNRDANVAMMFALSLIPVTIAAGAGLDLTRAMIVKSNLSEALDAAALSVASTSGLTTAQMQTQAQAYFNANYTVSSNYGTPATVTVTPGTQSVTVSTSVPMPTTLMGVAGIHTVDVRASSTVVWGQTKIWVALVLDNTGSMCQSDTNPNAGSPCPNPGSGTKIASLQSASHNLLTMLQNASANAGDVKVAIVPFVKDVNIGTSNAGASWIDWTSWDAANGTCDISSKHSQSSCTSTNGTWTWTAGTCTISSQTSQSGCTSTKGTWTAGSCNISSITSQSTCTSTRGTWSHSACNIPGYTTRSSCQNAYGTWTAAYCSISGITSQYTCTSTYGVWTWTTGYCNLSSYTTQSSCTSATAVWHVDHTQWNGCITDRGNSSGPDLTNNYDVMNTVPSTSTASKFPAEQYSSCPEAIMPLGYDWTQLGSEIDSMVANGSTNQTIGLMWGWHALSPSDPLNAGSPPANTSRYIIILSDGLNTQDRWYGNGSTQSTSVDDRMSAVCTNAKADGIIIYAIFVDIGGTQGNSSVMQNCATDSSKYWDLTSASQINGVFTAIGQQITNLRVSQ